MPQPVSKPARRCITLRLPEDIAAQAEEKAWQNRVSLNTYLTAAAHYAIGHLFFPTFDDMPKEPVG